MSLLIPIGLLGLLGVAVLIAIYIIKPNYQQKFVSSTYIWKLSLKYKKKSIPINHIKNLLIFLCQLLILTVCGVLLAQPAIEYERVIQKNEKIIVLDASASMMLTDGNATRFERAVEQIKDYAEIVIGEGGEVTVILAGSKSDFVAQNIDEENIDTLEVALDELISNKACTYGSADINGAMSLAEEMLNKNSEAEVILYTATQYIEKNGITVVDVSAEGEWNAAILGSEAKYDNNNHYVISIDVGCYGSTRSLSVYCKIIGGNGDLNGFEVFKTEYFDETEQEKRITFTTDDFNGTPLYEFESLQISIKEQDSFAQDNWYYVYGGKQQVIKVQYTSSKPNNFFAGAIRTIREIFKSTWSIDFDEVAKMDESATEGYDLYIFEHKMPEKLPTDGVVMLVNPDVAPKGSGFTVAGYPESVNSSSTLASGVEHPITRFINPNEITIAKYCNLRFSDDYEELLYYMGAPVLAVKNQADARIIVMGLDIHFSNFNISHDFPVMMYNVFNYFLPSTFGSYAYEVGENVKFTPRGNNFSVRTPDGKEYRYDEISANGLILSAPGAYTAMQDSLREEIIIEEFFVKVPEIESNVTKQVDALPEISAPKTYTHGYDDLLVYFAIALTALLFIEWWLHSREQI
ncbi:MAG: VWA domain-containing protein [Clostridia bacterium]|nr:VWA domain-containing protein [Clostridia bacterium]